MKSQKFFYVLFSLLLLLGIGLTKAGDGLQPKYQNSEKAFYLTEPDLNFIRPGLKLTIQRVEFDPLPNVNVTFRIADDKDQGLDRLGIQTPGVVSLNFVLSRIKPGDTQYTSYITRVQTSPITGVSAIQPNADSGGTYASLGDGVYKYTFGFKLPADFEVNVTHTLGIYARRDLTEFGFDLNSFVANAVIDFVPSSAPVTQVRDVVRTENCNQCHNPLALHGGIRREVRLCILCHNPSNTDPDTGNSVDAKVYIHKIHMGANLPSVKAGKPYQIIGFNQTVFDASTIVWPQDVRNCTTCHQKGTQSDNYKNNPNRAACGSCHDDVDFATGKNHGEGGVQLDDNQCSTCHPADSGVEFDLSVAGAHTIPTNSKQLAGVTVKIVEVTNTKPGDKPTVSFALTDNAGKPLDASKMNRLRLTLAGPTTDYTFRVAEDARSAKAGPTGYTYTFTAALPANASGSFAVGAEAFRNVTIAKPLAGQTVSTRESAFNPVVYFGIGGAKTAPRRTVVDVKNCNQCHKTLGLHFHSAARLNTEYCVLCHNPKFTDADQRPADKLPGETLNFRTMIHRIHTGEHLGNEYTTYDAQVPESWNEVRFPGDRRDCAKCHVNKSNQLPLPDGLANADTPRFFYTPLTPTASACLGCHDSQYAAAHAFVMTAPFGEACAACHGEGADFAVSKVHAR